MERMVYLPRCLCGLIARIFLEKLERFSKLVAQLSIKGLRFLMPTLPEITAPVVDLGRIEIVKQETLLDNLKIKLDKFWTGFGIGAKESIKELANFGQLGIDIAKNTAQAMTNFFSNLFFNVFTGQLKGYTAIIR